MGLVKKLILGYPRIIKIYFKIILGFNRPKLNQ